MPDLSCSPAAQSPGTNPVPSHNPTHPLHSRARWLTAPLSPPPSAHEEHKTPDQIAKFKAQQESAYHCAPAIAAQLAQRKRAAQQALGAAPSDPSTLFLGSDAFEKAQDRGQTILGCTPLEEAAIRNHT